MGEPMIDDEDNPYNYYFVPKKEHGYTLSNVNEGDYVLLNGDDNQYRLVINKREGNYRGYQDKGKIFTNEGIGRIGFYISQIQELWKPLPIGGGESNRKKSVRRRKGTKRRRQGTKRRKGTKRR